MEDINKNDVYVKKQWFIKPNTNKIEEVYDFSKKKVLGTGTYGQVMKVKKIKSKITRAVKQIPKNKVKDPERFKSEIEIMSKLDHPNIIKLYETFEDNRYVYLVMETCEGGELFDRIIDKGHFTEIEAKALFNQIIQALNYCHQNGIAHRDLKPENFLFLTGHNDSPVKIIDFGLSKSFKENETVMTTKAGTPYYISPEVLKGNYDQSCDIWSVGVILYILLSGVPPFFGDSDQEIIQAVQKMEYSFDIPEFDSVSEDAKDLIRKMICPVKDRLEAQQVLQHKWLSKDLKIKNKKLPLNFNALRNFTKHQKLKKVALTFIASQLSETEISNLGKLFRELDANGDGVLTIEEIKEGLADKNNISFNEVQQVIQAMDTDGSGKIEYTEFLAATMERSVYMKEEKLHTAFKMLDIDGNGKISKEELKETLGATLGNQSEEYWDEMIKEVDKNGDGEIDYDEFIEMMSQINNGV